MNQSWHTRTTLFRVGQRPWARFDGPQTQWTTAAHPSTATFVGLPTRPALDPFCRHTPNPFARPVGPDLG